MSLESMDLKRKALYDPQPSHRSKWEPESKPLTRSKRVESCIQNRDAKVNGPINHGYRKGLESHAHHMKNTIGWYKGHDTQDVENRAKLLSD